LVLSQVVLSFQLPFAIIPLIQMTSDRKHMGEFANRAWLQAGAWASAVLVVALNVIVTAKNMQEWADALREQGHSPWWVYGTLGPVAAALLGFLVWVTFYGWVHRPPAAEEPLARPELPAVSYRRVGVAVEFGAHDAAVLARAAAVAREQPD